MDKAALRREMEDRLRALSRARREDDSARVAARLVGSAAWAGAEAILTFLSMPTEIDTAPIIAAARAAGKVVAAPLIEAGDIRFVVLPAEASDLARDAWGIPVPDAGWPAMDLARATRPLVTAPGLAFDRQGNRLGRGKGYYDRFLSRARAACPGLTALAVCFSFQLVDAVPHGPRDVPVDGVVTEDAAIPTRDAASA